MKRINPIPLMAALLLSATVAAQVNVQPVSGVDLVMLKDKATLTVIPGDETRLESDVAEQLATVSNGVLIIGKNANATLRLSSNGPVRFEVKGNAELKFKGSFRFDNDNLALGAHDNAKVSFLGKSDADTIYSDNLEFSAVDNARIISHLPVNVVSFHFTAKDNGYVEIPAVAKHSLNDTTKSAFESVTLEGSGKIVILERGATGVYTFNPEKHYMIKHSSSRETFSDEEECDNKADRDVELNWFWGFNNWGHSPFAGFNGVDGDAAVSFYFMNVPLSFDFPLINRRHFGLYAGFGLYNNFYHFDSPLVNFNATTGFSTGTTSNVTLNSSTLSTDNWDSHLNTIALTLPVTFSFEPWRYDGFCLRLSVIPGIHVSGYLSQQYETNNINVTVMDKNVRKQMNPFMLDTRMSLQYGDFGIYVQAAMLPLFKNSASGTGMQTLYPLGFGVIWTLSGR